MVPEQRYQRVTSFSRTSPKSSISRPYLAFRVMLWLYRATVASLLLCLVSAYRLVLPTFAVTRSVRRINSTPLDHPADLTDQSANSPNTNRSLPTLLENASTEEYVDKKQEIEKFMMLYTCKLCSFRNTNMVSKVGFYKGMVVSTCKGCQSMHLIADNERKLDFGEDGFSRADEYLISKGEKVQEMSATMFELRNNYLVEKDGVLTLVPKTQEQPLDGTVVQLPKALQDKLA